MARNDYFVLVYRILAYLYECLKEGEKPNIEYISAENMGIPVSYHEYILKKLYEDGYIEGVLIVPILGREKGIKLKLNVNITPKGIEFLQENSTMNRAKDFLKTLKETIPGL